MALIKNIPTISSSEIEDILDITISSQWTILFNNSYTTGASQFPLTGNNFNVNYTSSTFTFTITNDCNVFLISKTNPTHIVKNTHMSAGETVTMTLSEAGNVGLVFATF